MENYSCQIFDVGNGIPAEIKGSWRNLQAKNPNLVSPFFSPEFIEIVARTCANVEVAVWRAHDEVVAIFPYERKKWNFAGPVGQFLSDYDGLITRPDFVRDPAQILRDCRLVAWDFSHSLATDVFFVSGHKSKSNVALTDMRCGFEEYIRKHKATDHRQLKNYFKRMQKLEEEAGPLNFVMHSGDESLLAKLLELKSAQFKRNGWRDIFAIPWVTEVLRAIHRTQSSDFAGMLSALYAGQHLVALHFGMRSTKVLHRWFPTHDETFSRYSPGIVLNLKMLEICPRFGIETIDWGAGEHQLKQFVMDASIPTGSGSVELPCAATLARRLVRFPSEVRRFIGKTRVGGAARRFRKWVRA